MPTRINVEVNLNRTKVQVLVTERRSRAAEKGARAIQARARILAPKDTGRLAESIDVTLERVTADTTVYEVGSTLYYAPYQNFGTGPIYAKPGGVLVFTPKGGGAVVFTKRTRGVPATHFMEEAVRSTKITY